MSKWSNRRRDTVAPAGNFDLLVYAPAFPGQPASIVERFINLSTTAGDSRFVDSALVNGIADQFNASQYVETTTIRPGVPVAGTYYLGQGAGTVGVDGISTLADADYVGTVSGQTPTGLQALTNAETYQFDVLIIPGVSHTAVITAAALTLADTRQDFLYLVDPPFGLSVSQIISWVNGGQPMGVPDSPAAAINDSFGDISWPWIEQYDAYNKQYVWQPPSGWTAGLMAATDFAIGPWLPAARTGCAVCCKLMPSNIRRRSLIAIPCTGPISIPTSIFPVKGLRDTETRRCNVLAGFERRRRVCGAC